MAQDSETPDQEEEKLAVAIDRELETVTGWRLHVLMEAGYSHDIAQVLAQCADVDLHRAVLMVEQGCKPSMAMAILL